MSDFYINNMKKNIKTLTAVYWQLHNMQITEPEHAVDMARIKRLVGGLRESLKNYLKLQKEKTG